MKESVNVCVCVCASVCVSVCICDHLSVYTGFIALVCSVSFQLSLDCQYLGTVLDCSLKASRNSLAYCPFLFMDFVCMYFVVSYFTSSA